MSNSGACLSNNNIYVSILSNQSIIILRSRTGSIYMEGQSITFRHTNGPRGGGRDRKMVSSMHDFQRSQSGDVDFHFTVVGCVVAEWDEGVEWSTPCPCPHPYPSSSPGGPGKPLPQDGKWCGDPALRFPTILFPHQENHLPY